MPWPIDVPRSGARRLIVARRALWSFVGACTEKPLSLKATTPICTVSGCCSTKSRAAALAASMRVGFRSSAAMLPETSNARMTVPSTLGRLTTVCGRASATSRIVSPARKSSRRDVAARAGWSGLPGLCRPKTAEACGELPPAALEAQVEQHQQREQHEQNQHGGPDEGHRSGSPRLPQGGEAHDGAHQVIFGRERQRIHPGALERLVQGSASRSLRRLVQSAGGISCRACPHTAARRSRHPP